MERWIHTDIRTNPDHRQLFYDLTQTVFGFDLGRWHELGLWTPKYTPHAYIEDGRMVANVSAYDMRLVVAGQERRAVQIGTVMTHPEYRGRGYASELMEHVVQRKAADADLMFLFTSPHLIPFYQQNGFEVVKEWTIHTAPVEREGTPDTLRRIDPNDDTQRAWLLDRVRRRRPVSQRFGILDGSEIFMYHALYRFADGIWHDESQDCFVVAVTSGPVLNLLDVVSDHEVDVRRILASLSVEGVDVVEVHFTPDRFDLETTAEVKESDDIFMVRGNAFDGMSGFRHPVTLEA